MKRIDLARFILGEIRAKHNREIERAVAEATTPTAPDPQLEGITEFLKSKPFGCHTEKARIFAEKVTGKRISKVAVSGKECHLGRLRLGVVVNNLTGHDAPVGETILSLTRGGNYTRVLGAGTDQTAFAPINYTIRRNEVRKLTADEASAWFASVDNERLLLSLGSILAPFKVTDLCEREE